MFHKEGYTIIGITLVFVALLSGVVYTTLGTGILACLLFTVLFVFLVLILQFFRNPKRNTVVSLDTVVSPVDGKVVVIEEVFEKEFYNEKRLQVSIFMSPINVHVTRYPISGKVLYSKYHPGKFLVAWHPKSSQDNERTSVVVANDKISLLYRQVAGFLARRIVNYAKEGQTPIQGSDSGFIKFGSRIDLYLPLGTKLNVNLDDVVKGGETVLVNLD